MWHVLERTDVTFTTIPWYISQRDFPSPFGPYTGVSPLVYSPPNTINIIVYAVIQTSRVIRVIRARAGTLVAADTLDCNLRKTRNYPIGTNLFRRSISTDALLFSYWNNVYCRMDHRVMVSNGRDHSFGICWIHEGIKHNYWNRMTSAIGFH